MIISHARPASGRPGNHRSRSSALEFGAYPGAVPSARLHTRAVLDEWGLAGLSDDTEAVVTELTENAVQATIRAALDAPVRLTLIAGPRSILIAVRDSVTEPPAPRQPLASPDALAPWTGDDDADPDQHGNGLLIVAALAAHWDWKRTPDGGKVVRAVIRAGAEEPARLSGRHR